MPAYSSAATTIVDAQTDRSPMFVHWVRDTSRRKTMRNCAVGLVNVEKKWQVISLEALSKLDLEHSTAWS